ncbi:MAG: hypothetical protein ACI8ZM_005716 [Crocinitomix sp.]|jgi:hypothetical protein
MEVFSKIFFIATSGLFIALFMLLIEHPKRMLIGFIIFGIIALLIIGSIPILALIPSLCPFLIFLDAKRLTLKICLIYLVFFILTIVLSAIFIVPFMPFYYYPILVFAYVLLAKITFERMQTRNKQIEEII